MERFGKTATAILLAVTLTFVGCAQAHSAELSVRTVAEAPQAQPARNVIHTIGTVAPTVVIQCPEGTRHLGEGEAAAEIRQIGANTEQVLTPGFRNDCVAIGAGQTVVYATSAQSAPATSGASAPLQGADLPLQLRSGRHPEASPAIRICVAKAASAMHLEQAPLYLILAVEGGSLGHVSPNSNGTYDIGPAQINSSWLPVLAKQGITESALKNDLCTNILASAWIYKRGFDRTHSTLGALALYHSPKPKYQLQYLHRIDQAVVERLAYIQQAGIQGIF